MHKVYWLILGMCSLVLACKREAKPASLPVTQQTCTELDSLFQVLGSMDSALIENADWAVCKPFLQASLAPLSYNQREGNTDCNYLDQKYRPEEPRLLWVESLRSRIETDTIAEGIYYLLRWRGAFNHDPEISEFFSEELSYVAMNNPQSYWQYIEANPDQEVMLLYSTKWNRLDLDTLIARFGRIEAANPVHQFLQNMREQKTDGI